MIPITLSERQRAAIARPIESKVFLEGPAGTGKTAAGVERLLHLLEAGVPARSVLVLTPQRALAARYDEALRRPTVGGGAAVSVFTVGGLAQRTVDLFWPLVAGAAGFTHPKEAATFLTLETAQYYMARLVRPLLDEGYFESVTIDRNRLYSQIIDDLNKAAVVGFPYTEIGDRLKAAWGGDASRERIYDQAQICASRFRRYCLDNNLLDFSLQVETFLEHLWTRPICRNYLLDRYRHLIVDNVEEDTPVAHDLVREWLSSSQSALLIYDAGAGYRRFMGADPESAYSLRELCDERITFTQSFVTSPSVEALAKKLACSFRGSRGQTDGGAKRRGGEDTLARDALAFEYHRYHPQMLDWVAERIATLIHQREVLPGEIVVLAPFLSDALRFSLTNRLKERGVPIRSHRPSRALREEPATRCLLTLAAIAHPAWGIRPSRFDVAYALMQAIEGMDLVRAQLLAEIVYRFPDERPMLGSFDRINAQMQERLTFVLGERYERLRVWINEYIGSSRRQSTTLDSSGPAEISLGTLSGGTTPRRDLRGLPFDHFLSHLFGEVLSQKGYGFHDDHDAAEVAANLIESVRKFRWVTVSARGSGSVDDGENPVSDSNGLSTQGYPRLGTPSPLGKEYIRMVEEGVIAAQYVRSWQLELEDAVLLAPAYTFIIRNRPVDYQFWLNVGGRGWWERLYQPLTHPYVLSRHWPPSDREEATWTDSDEVDVREDALHRLTQGLFRRCRRKVYLGLSELGEQGYEQRGPLLQAIQRVLRRLPPEPAG